MEKLEKSEQDVINAKKRIVEQIFSEMKEQNIRIVDLVELSGLLCYEAVRMVKPKEEGSES